MIMRRLFVIDVIMVRRCFAIAHSVFNFDWAGRLTKNSVLRYCSLSVMLEVVFGLLKYAFIVCSSRRACNCSFGKCVHVLTHDWLS